MSERASMPTFVPRTVASFERAAGRVAQRVYAPMRRMARRAFSLTERVIASWAPEAAAVGIYGAGRSPLRIAERAGGRITLLPWYELDAGDEADVQSAARPILDAETASVRAVSAAERGAAIARTTLEAAHAGENAAAGDAAPERGVARAIVASASTTERAPAARAPSIAMRALRHVAWADSSSRILGERTERPVAAAVPGLVLVQQPLPGGDAIATAIEARPQPGAATPTGTGTATATGTGTTTGTGTPTPTGTGTAAGTGTPTGTTTASAAAHVVVSPPSLGWVPGLPDMRVAAVLPGRGANEITEFLARLVGVGAARDAAPLVPASAAEAPPRASRAPAPTWLAGVEPAPASSSPAPQTSFRPGAATARIEHAAAAVDARASALWIAPAPTAATPLPVAAPIAAATVSPPLTATATVTATRASWTLPVIATEAAPRGAGVAAPPAARTAASAPAPVWTWAAPPRAAAGPAALAQFVDERVGVRAVAATAPLPLPPPVVTAAGDRAAAPRREAINGSQPVFALGGVARAAEQLGGSVGVRAAGLSMDFVDPARLAMLGGAAPVMTTVAPAAEAPARDAEPVAATQTLMPRAQPLFATPAPARATAALSAEEWALVTTFPSVATAVQLAAARQASDWRALSGGRFAAEPRPMLSFAGSSAPAATDVAMTTSSTATASTMAPGERRAAVTEHASAVTAGWPPARLPSGRAPRGGFIWPKLAEPRVRAADWAPPAAVVLAEHVKHQAPGTTLWEAMPALAAGGATASAEPVDEAGGVASAAAAAVTAQAAASPSRTLVTAAAQRGARADSATEGAHRADGQAPASPTAGAPRAARAGAQMPTLLPPLAPSPPASGAKGRALELARPFLRLIEGGIASDEGRPSTPRFFEQPQPLVSAVPASDAASRIVEATRTRPQASSTDERMTLAELTLIAMASATQQVAASPEGGSGAEQPPPAAAAPAGAAGGQAAAAASGNATQDIEELARAAFAELLRLQELERERSGNHGW